MIVSTFLTKSYLTDCYLIKFTVSALFHEEIASWVGGSMGSAYSLVTVEYAATLKSYLQTMNYYNFIKLADCLMKFM